MDQSQQDPNAGEAETDDGGYTILIRVDGAGKISVSVENESGEPAESTEGPEGPEGSAQDPAENEDAEMSAPTPAANIKEALTMALEAYKNQGTMPESNADQKAFGAGWGLKGGGMQ